MARSRRTRRPRRSRPYRDLTVGRVHDLRYMYALLQRRFGRDIARRMMQYAYTQQHRRRWRS